MNARNPVFVAMENQEQAPPIGLDTLFTTCEQLQQAGQAQQALDMYQSWLAQSQDANRHMAWFNYGSLQQSTGNPAAAIEAYKECLVLQPSFPQALINLGLTLEKMGKRDEALQQWATLVSKRLLKDGPSPDMLVLALNHIGRVQEDLKQYDMAEEALEQSLALNPKQPGVIQHWVHIRQKACAWPVYKPLPNITQNEMLMATSPLAMLALTDDPVQQLLTAFAFVERTYGFKEEFLSKGREYRHDRLRIGYVSGDLCVHAVGLLLPELLEGHDKSKFEIYGYDFSPEDGTAHRERLKKAFDHLRPIRALTDRQVAELVMADEIDVLIDLHGLSSGARPGIFALHPAPKQGTYLGFIGTTGMPWFDFVIADRYALPEELTPYFTEKPLYVEGSFIPLTRDDTPVREATRAEFGLPDDAFVMAAFGNVYKITPEMFATWMEILKEIPRAVLWLIDDNPTTTANIKKHAFAAKADLNRILFTTRSAHSEYKAKLKLADVFLDTFPYNCGSTTNDVMNSKTPLVTLSGKTLVSRMGMSILKDAYTSDCIPTSYLEYTDLVCEISKNPRKTKSEYLKLKNSKLFSESIFNYLDNKKTDLASRDEVRLEIRQICYSEDTLKNIPDGFLPLNNLENLRPDWREYWPIRNYLLNNHLDNNCYYGFFSPKFTQKTGLSYVNVSNFLAEDKYNSEIYIFSPFWDLTCLFKNVFEQGDFFHNGLMDASQKFVNKTKLNIDLTIATTHSQNTIFCNYFVAKKSFWIKWLILAEQLFTEAEHCNSELAILLNNNTNYGAQFIPRKIF
ncbi:O-linked N-acetylglucosamine transferase, SPINDLY family protein, partial [Limnohabitans sp.]|uniref:O-linked N-acetylglucosamine transferase, SPINDLY family protein n=1 Tax=Limnohabitans sp. TaxID=1907725 RepID=UPI002FDD62B5